MHLEAPPHALVQSGLVWESSSSLRLALPMMTPTRRLHGRERSGASDLYELSAGFMFNLNVLKQLNFFENTLAIAELSLLVRVLGMDTHARRISTSIAPAVICA